MTKPRRLILQVDDSEEDRSVVRDWLKQSQEYEYDFAEAESVAEGLTLLERHRFDCVILDYSFPVGSAFDFLKHVLALPLERRVPVVVLTGQGDEQVAVRAMRAGAHDYINKSRFYDSGDGAGRVIEDAVTDFNRQREFIQLQAERDLALEHLRDREATLAAMVEELKLAKQEAEGANTAKSVFLANMSHEIRSPLTAIIGFTELLRDGPADSEMATQFYETIHRNGIHLLSVINDILDFSKIEAGKVEVVSAPLDLSALITDIANSFRPAMRTKALAFRVFIHPHLPKLVVSDMTRIRQVLNNLLSNALKFTLTGEIALIVYRENDENQAISFVVADSGIGVARTDIDKLFRRFTQANATINAQFGGSGLGLILSRKLAELLDGDLDLISSESGVGSMFRFRIPAVLPPADTTVAPVVAVTPEFKLEKVRIALADDSLDNQDLLRRILEGVGAEVECASDGQELIDLVHRQKFDIVLLDVQMPKLGGHDAARILRREGNPVPIVGLTAHAFPEDRARSFAAGFNDQLAKPIDMGELLRTIHKLVESAPH